jgi:hypothetical protein
MRYIDPDTFALVGDGDDVPPCPVCLAPIEIDMIDVTTWGSTEPEYVIGQWECPNGCDPRTADPRYLGR